MKKQSNSTGIINSSSRTFTFSQLSKISDDNYDILNNCIDMSFFNADDIFVLNPVMIHYHARGKEVDPHLRAKVTRLDESNGWNLQDLTFDQWEQGKELVKTAS